MKQLDYQQRAVGEVVEGVVSLLNSGRKRCKLVLEAPTGSGKTVIACQALAEIVEALRDRGDTLYQEVAFIWLAPRKLHLQSYMKLKGAFGENKRLRPLMFDELEKAEGIQPGEILFVNWESVNKDNNVMVRTNESTPTLYEVCRITREEQLRPIVAVIDEEHMFWSKTADKSAQVLERIKPDVELRISATPRTRDAQKKVSVLRHEVVQAQMIKKEVVLNPEITLSMSSELELNHILLKAALSKRNQLAEAYRQMHVDINPLLLIQLPNDKTETMTADDSAVAQQVKTILQTTYDITTGNNRLAVWLANEKANLDGLEEPTNLTEVLLFKEAIALGWDCPRAAVLLIYRKLQSDRFTIQTVGRILRMPQQRHYPLDVLNVGYVYTDLARDRIEVVATDADYLLKDAFTARRREGLHNVCLESYYAERPSAQRMRISANFKQALQQEITQYFSITQGDTLFSLEEMAGWDDDANNSRPLAQTTDAAVLENRERAARKGIRLDVKNINVEIPEDVHFQNEQQTLQATTVKYARKVGEINRVFAAYIATKGHQFEARERTKIGDYLVEVLCELFGMMDWDAKKVVLYSRNRPKFDLMLDRALEAYARKRDNAKQQAKATREFKKYDWSVPEERVYEGETHHVEEADRHALQPFVQLNTAYSPERDFEAFLEAHHQCIDWWYKNGDSGMQHYAITYSRGEHEAPGLFYVDFVVRMKNGHVYLFDTKSAGSDLLAPQKHNALLKYISEHTRPDAPLYGGIIVRNGDNWLYSPLPIENTEDTLHWNSFYPEQA